MVVQSLSHQLQCQLIAHAARLLHLSAFVLEPDFDLRLVELQLVGQRLATFLRQVFAVVKLALKPIQLCGSECRSRSLLVGDVIFLLLFASPWSCT